MTDKEMINELAVLEPKMHQYATTAKVMLTANDIRLLLKLYPQLQLRAAGQLPMIFNTGCSSCVASVFNVFISYYYRVKPTLVEGDNC